MITERKTGKFVYKNEESMHKMHEFYDKAMDLLNVDHREEFLDQKTESYQKKQL